MGNKISTYQVIDWFNLILMTNLASACNSGHICQIENYSNFEFPLNYPLYPFYASLLIANTFLVPLQSNAVILSKAMGLFCFGAEADWLKCAFSLLR
jgi:hypothetical protein